MKPNSWYKKKTKHIYWVNSSVEIGMLTLFFVFLLIRTLTERLPIIFFFAKIIFGFSVYLQRNWVIW